MHGIHLKQSDHQVKHRLYEAASQNPSMISLRTILMHLNTLMYLLLLLSHLRHQTNHLAHQFSRRFQIVTLHLIFQRLVQLLGNRLRLRLICQQPTLFQLQNARLFVQILPFVVRVHVPSLPINTSQISARSNIHLHGNIVIRLNAHPIPPPSLDGLRPLVRSQPIRHNFLNFPSVLLLVLFVVRIFVPRILLLPLRGNFPVFIQQDLVLLPRQIRTRFDGIFEFRRTSIIDVKRVMNDPILLKIIVILPHVCRPIHDPILQCRA
mmetsp:Transcript_6327/g.11544  ORF Transcript_6327/g.11544 Transcript_6327/m.11544 type:complete len:265 (+) Transcript_6327:532-1326(+)